MFIIKAVLAILSIACLSIPHPFYTSVGIFLMAILWISDDIHEIIIEKNRKE